MLKIRLTRRGKKNRAFYRLVVAEHTSPIKGRFVESLGFLNPHTKEKGLKEDRIKYWLEKGAQCSDTVHNLLVSNGIVKGPKRSVKIKKKEETEKKPEEAAKKTDEAKPEEKKEKTEEPKAEEKAEPAEEKKEEIKTEKAEDKG
jgi:small subunit ribosomal protein S16